MEQKLGLVGNNTI